MSHLSQPTSLDRFASTGLEYFVITNCRDRSVMATVLAASRKKASYLFREVCQFTAPGVKEGTWKVEMVAYNTWAVHYDLFRDCRVFETVRLNPSFFGR
jgi:hypothetical protein